MKFADAALLGKIARCERERVYQRVERKFTHNKLIGCAIDSIQSPRFASMKESLFSRTRSAWLAVHDLIAYTNEALKFIARSRIGTACFSIGDCFYESEEISCNHSSGLPA